MAEFVQTIEQLFVDAQVAPVDTTGALEELLRFGRPLGAAAVVVLDSTGTIHTTYPHLEFGSPVVEQLRQSLRDRERYAAADGAEAPRMVWAHRAAPRVADGQDVLILLDGDERRSPTACELQCLETLSRQALRILGVNQSMREQHARQAYYEAERDTLTRSHRETVQRIMEEREQRLNEKHRYIDQLEIEVEKRSAAMREALRQAEQASQSKTEFLANMSHEIRTPMTAILGFAENLLDNSMEEAEAREAVETILRNGRHLLGIINDILDISKIEAGRLEADCVPFAPHELILEVFELMHDRARDRGLQFDVEFASPLPTTLVSDPMRLRQIIVNLVGNALKFTHRGGVTIRVACSQEEATAPSREGEQCSLKIDVVDSGIGMTAGQIAIAFEPFAQADSSVTRRYGGTGLGLTISRKLAKVLGGDLTAKSAPGEGTTFTIQVAPKLAVGTQWLSQADLALLRRRNNRNETNNGAPRDDSVDPLAGTRILLADDGPDNQRLISFVLKKAGANIKVVENGQMALEAADEALRMGCPFDVILMDMQMPVLDGYRATRRLRDTGYTHPIIALTAHAMTGDRQKCMAAGCDQFATKPIKRQELISMIARIVHGETTNAAEQT